MDEINSLFQGFAVISTPMNLLLMFVGIVLGVLIGVLPGLGGANGVAILLPLTFSMSPTTATNAPTKEEVNAAVSASPARPFCASG